MLQCRLLRDGPCTPWLVTRAGDLAVAPTPAPCPLFLDPTHAISPMGDLTPLTAPGRPVHYTHLSL